MKNKKQILKNKINKKKRREIRVKGKETEKLGKRLNRKLKKAREEEQLMNMPSKDRYLLEQLKSLSDSASSFSRMKRGSI